MREIKLSQNGKYKDLYVALVDDEDFERINQFKWYVFRHHNVFYAIRGINVKGKRITIYMHCDIMGCKGIDHKDSDGLNCQKYNLRKCTQSQNIMNTRPRENCTSKYKGVHWYTSAGKWKSVIKLNRKLIFLGCFTSEVEAAMTYDLKAKELFGEFAFFNFKQNE